MFWYCLLIGLGSWEDGNTHKDFIDGLVEETDSDDKDNGDKGIDSGGIESAKSRTKNKTGDKAT